MTRPAPPDFDVASAYPDVARLRSIVAAHDWPGIQRFFDSVPDETIRAFFVSNAADVRGSEDFFSQQVRMEKTPGLAHTFLGARYVRIGWEIRTGKRATQVSAEQFAELRKYLCKAEQLLIDATAARPDNVAAWAERLTTSMGLEMGKSEAHRRYGRLARHSPHYFIAQSRMVQLLCPKWSGSWETLFEFARKCVADAPPGNICASMIAEAHIERWYDIETDAEGKQYLSQAHAEVAAAADKSVGHPAYQPQYGWVAAHNLFAYFFTEAGDYDRAAHHFQVIGNHASFPWWDTPEGADAFVSSRSRAWRGRRR